MMIIITPWLLYCMTYYCTVWPRYSTIWPVYCGQLVQCALGTVWPIVILYCMTSCCPGEAARMTLSCWASLPRPTCPRPARDAARPSAPTAYPTSTGSSMRTSTCASTAPCSIAAYHTSQVDREERERAPGAVDPQSFFADPDPAVFLSADLNPALKNLFKITLWTVFCCWKR